MNESASFMEVPEIKESVRPARSKLWAIVRYGFGGLVLFALGEPHLSALSPSRYFPPRLASLKLHCRVARISRHPGTADNAATAV